ncbi:MAG: VanZ family protein [Anaerolineae bacterium]|nr:VanZ family protein [Anaerolineae bacterium]
MYRFPSKKTAAPALAYIYRSWALIITICTLLIILYTTLFPFDFVFIKNLSLINIFHYFDWPFVKPDSKWDFARNVLLFLPWGFGLTGLLATQKISRYLLFFLIVAVSLLLSSTIEILQIFLTDRTTSILDIVSNGLGAWLGVFLFYGWGEKILSFIHNLLRNSLKFLSPKILLAGLTLYLVSIGLIVVYLQQGNTLHNWNTTYPLIIGNEKTGDRPWQGYIRYLFLTDTAAAPQQVEQIFSQGSNPGVLEPHVVAAYQFLEQNENLNEPSLQTMPVRAKQNDSSAQGFHLTTEHWLETTAPATTLSEKLIGSSQFTLDTMIATADLDQTGPARIVSISHDPYNRNLTVSQEEDTLSIRLRTPLTGKNGFWPELIVPHVFQDTNPHHLVITYDGFNVIVYIDQPEQRYRFTYAPEIMFFRYLMPIDAWKIRLTSQSWGILKILFYTLVITPPALIIALMIHLKRENHEKSIREPA